MPDLADFSVSRENIVARETPLAEENVRLPLDQLSIRQTKKVEPEEISAFLQAEIDFELEQSHAVQAAKCERGAPFIFFIDNNGRARVVQGCCNSWECPRCGQIRARHEYGRVLHGAKELAAQGHTLYFWTLTCRGRDMPLDEAMRDYYVWTNRLLTACRAKAKRDGQFWAYAQMTERQKRQHPHSHLITTWCPPDAIPTIKAYENAAGEPRERQVMASAWFAKRNASAGLGPQHEISVIENPEGAAVYASKYFFKDCMNEAWPKKWRRVRYSRSWPKLPEQETEVAFPLLKMSDWQRMQDLGLKVYADSEITLEAAYARLVTCVVFEQGDE